MEHLPPARISEGRLRPSKGTRSPNVPPVPQTGEYWDRASCFPIRGELDLLQIKERSLRQTSVAFRMTSENQNLKALCGLFEDP